MVSKPCQDQFLNPILVHSMIEKKENTSSQMGHTKKYFLKTAKVLKRENMYWKFCTLYRIHKIKIVSLTKLQSISDKNIKLEIKISVFLVDKNLQSNIEKKSYILIIKV